MDRERALDGAALTVLTVAAVIAITLVAYNEPYVFGFGTAFGLVLWSLIRLSGR